MSCHIIAYHDVYFTTAIIISSIIITIIIITTTTKAKARLHARGEGLDLLVVVEDELHDVGVLALERPNRLPEGVLLVPATESIIFAL